uniref:Uncharacterized protein n=1 Tax=Daphnia galeata TaxID=27404 RepID=A0A8J2RB60_9CRUS|nr:unnamed protein product [Daphnia galeata]
MKWWRLKFNKLKQPSSMARIHTADRGIQLPASVVFPRQYETSRNLLSAACSISTQYLLNYILCILRAEMQLRSPSATAVIYRSGKVTVMGTRSEREAGMAALKFTRIIAKALHRDLEMERLEILQCSSHKLYAVPDQSRQIAAKYEPEIAPYGTLRVEDPKATANIYSTGSISITASSEADVHAAMEQIYAIVKEYRIN